MTARRAEIAGVAGITTAAALLFSRGLDAGPNYDEGVYLATADALARDGELGSEVFASQPPGFYALLQAAVALPGDSVEATRVPFLLLALAGVVGAWGLGRLLTGATGGLGAATLLAVAPGYASNAARIAADVPAVALAVIGLALLVRAVRCGGTALAVAAGAALAAAVAVKLLVASVAVPALLTLAFAVPATRRVPFPLAAGALAVPVVLAAVHAGALGALWDDAVGFHADARGEGLNVERVARAFDPHAPWGLIALAGTVVWAALRASPRALVPSFAWAAAAAAFLVWHRPLLDHHFALLAGALSVPAGAAIAVAAWRTRARAATVAVLALALAAGYLQQWRAIERLQPPDADVEAAAAALRRTTEPDELIAGDLPIVAVLAGRGLPGELVDTSAVRFEAGSLRAADVLALVDEEGIRTIVVGRMFTVLPGLGRELERRFPEERRVGEITLRRRDRAAARAAQAAARG